MREHDAADVMQAFNEAITAQDVEALAALMSDDHRFVDAAGGTVEGKPACLEAWRGFFGAYPDYRNHFDVVAEEQPGLVHATGSSTCSNEPALVGDAHWWATVRDGLVTEWRVSA